MKPNILLITIDSLRADHLQCYGYDRPTSPNIDALAAQGVLCEKMFCSALPTQPSYTTLYTGQHPITHNVVAHGGKVALSRQSPFLPETLLAQGYTTCAVDNLMRERLWYGRGYEYYIDPSLRRSLFFTVTAEELNARAIPWMRAHADEPFFLCMHYWDVHYPYTPPAAYRDRFYQGNPTDPSNHSLDGWDHPIGAIARDTWLRTPKGPITDADYVTALYDQELCSLDAGIGQLVGALDELGLAEQTIVMLIADHGESMTEHNVFYDHYGLYDCTLRIPAIVRWPGHLPAGTRIPHLLQHHDIAPTLLEAAGVPIPAAMDGRSFWTILGGDTSTAGRKQIISLECTWQAAWSLRTDTHKLIVNRDADASGLPPRELYDLLADPDEVHNLALEQPLLADELEADLESWIAQQLLVQGKKVDPLVEQGASMRATWLEHQ